MDILAAINQILTWAVSPDIQQSLFPIKVVFILFSAFFFLIIVYFMFTSTFFKYKFILDLTDFFNIEPAGVRRIRIRWEAIQKRLGVGSESELKLAIIEADGLFNDVLNDKGFAGKTFEEKISQVKKVQIPNTDVILENHKIRNNIVHDPNFRLTQEQTKKVLDTYERAIKDVESF